jgi:hypothetical protein
MSDRELLLRWLSKAAARLGRHRRARELGRAACTLAALWLFGELLRVVGTPAPVVAALAPLLIMGAVGALALFAWRIARPSTPLQAASAADRRAGLKDQLRSAYWFAQDADADAFVQLLLSRAARTANALELRRTFPSRVPRSMLAALLLALATGALAWLSPRVAFPPSQAATSDSSADAVLGGTPAVGERPLASPGRQSEAPHRDSTGAWADIERLAKALAASPEQDAVKRAIAARDARLAAQLLEGGERSRGSIAPPEGAARPQPDIRAAQAKRLLDALKELSEEMSKVKPEPPIKADVSPTVRTVTNVRDRAQEERRKIEGTPMQGAVTPNNRMRAMARNGAGMREVQFGEGEAAEGGNRASVSGAAEGERSGKSQSGGSEGESKVTAAAEEGDDGPVLGERTERLAAQLEKMAPQRRQDATKQEAVEGLYAATQRQTSEVAHQALDARWRTQREATVAPGGATLPYREAVKQYFLSQHARED